MEASNRNMNSLSLKVAPEFDDVGPSQRTMSALVQVVAKQQSEQELRIPIEISAVIDRSGSMQGPKLDMVKKTLEFFTTQLTARDKLGIIAYDDQISVPFPLVEMGSDAKARAKTAINQIESGGSTDLCEGLLCGIRQVSNKPIPNADRPPVQRLQQRISPPFQYPIQQIPIQQAPILQIPIQQAPIQQIPIQQIPIQQIPIQQAPIQQAPIQQAPILQIPIQQAPIQQAPILQIPIQQAPIQQAPIQQAPIQQAPILQIPIQQAPIQQAPIQQAPAEPEEKPEEPLPKPEEKEQSPKSSTGVVSRSVLLFTDGQANYGSTRAPEIIAAMKALLGEVGGSINVFTFGFGDDHDANLLGALSQEANGTYYYINSQDKIRESFADCLGGLLSIAAQNIVVDIHALPEEAEYVSVESSYNVIPLPGNPNGIRVSIPDLYDEEVRDVLVNIRIKPRSENFNDSHPYLHTVATYMDIALQQERTIDCIATILRVESGAQVAPNAKVDCCRNRWLAIRAIEDARKKAERGQLTEAKALLEEAIKRIRDSVSFADPVSQAALEDLQKCKDGMRSQDEYARHGDKYSRMVQQTMAYQRSSAASASSANYVTTRKEMMMKKSREMEAQKESDEY